MADDEEMTPRNIARWTAEASDLEVFALLFAIPLAGLWVIRRLRRRVS